MASDRQPYPLGLGLIAVYLGVGLVTGAVQAFSLEFDWVSSVFMLLWGGMLYGLVRRRAWGIMAAEVCCLFGAAVIVLQTISWMAGKYHSPAWYLLPCLAAAPYLWAFPLPRRVRLPG